VELKLVDRVEPHFDVPGDGNGCGFSLSRSVR
jgi:hypothetical protein